MDNISLIILLCIVLLVIFVGAFVALQFVKSMIANQKFKHGTTIVSAVVTEIFESFNNGKFYIIRAQFTSESGEIYKYRSKRLRNNPQLKVGDRINVEVATKDYTVYRKIG